MEKYKNYAYDAIFYMLVRSMILFISSYAYKGLKSSKLKLPLLAYIVTDHNQSTHKSSKR